MTTAQTAIVLTPGEPAGIGPDLAILASRFELDACLAVCADADMLRRRARALGISLEIEAWSAVRGLPGRWAS